MDHNKNEILGVTPPDYDMNRWSLMAFILYVITKFFPLV